MRVLMSGGGTAGHIYPALTVAEGLLVGGHDDVLFVGTPDGLEATLVPEAGVRFEVLAAQGYDRARPLTLFTSSVRILASAVAAIRLIRRFRPDVVLGFGGYVSIPVGVGAVLTRTPLVLHEQNSVPGLANRILSRWATWVGVTYESSIAHLAHPDRVVVTGNPVRAAVLRADGQNGRAGLGIPEDAVLLLVFGGSRGARHINHVVTGIAHRLLAVPNVHIVHVTGRGEYADVVDRVRETGADTDRYHVRDYVDDMGSLIAAADLIVARAGATSLAEMTVLGRAAILVPYPYATDDHQTTNAETVVSAGGAIMVPDAELDDERFVHECLRLLGDADARATMAAASARLGRPDAGALVASLAERATRTHGRNGRDSEVSG